MPRSYSSPRCLCFSRRRLLFGSIVRCSATMPPPPPGQRHLGRSGRYLYMRIRREEEGGRGGFDMMQMPAPPMKMPGTKKDGYARSVVRTHARKGVRESQEKGGRASKQKENCIGRIKEAKESNSYFTPADADADAETPGFGCATVPRHSFLGHPCAQTLRLLAVRDPSFLPPTPTWFARPEK